mgnify:CR=1 FL=1
MQEKSKETENIEIDLREIFGVLIHRLWIIVVAALVCGAVAFMYSFFVITPQYESTTKVYILNKQNVLRKSMKRYIHEGMLGKFQI